MKKDLRTLKDRIIDIDLNNQSTRFWVNLARQRVMHMKEWFKDADSVINREDIVDFLEITLEELWNAGKSISTVDTEAQHTIKTLKENNNDN